MDEKLINFEANFSVLERYGEDITANTFITNPAIGRDEEIKELILVLLTPEKSAILIGKPGIGKTAIVEGLAYRMQRGEVPDALKGYTIINIKTASLLGTMPSGESKVQKMIDELKTREKVILFVDEIHMLIGATDSSSLDFANIFKEGLGRGSIKVIGATTTEEYEKYILRDKAFTRRFQKIEVPEPTRDETIKIMMGTLPKFEKQTSRKMKYTPFIQERIMSFLVDITSEYKRVFALGSRYPDVCLTLLKQAFSYTVYDNRQYMDIFDIRKAIENSKNIYPDVIKKELPRFDKEFNDIILEEKGEKKVEEWRKDEGPTRYEQAVKSNFFSNTDNNDENDSSSDSGLKILEAVPSMVDKKTLKERQPVKTIMSEKTLKKFAKIGPTAISSGLKDRFNQKNVSRNIDDLLLSSQIEVITKDNNTSINKPIKYAVTDELKPGGTTNILLGTPITSTLDDYKEEQPKVVTYKSDNIFEKELDPNRNNLILDIKTKNNENNTNSFERVDDMSFFNKEKNIDTNDNKTSFFDKSLEKENEESYNTKNDLKSGFLFGAPMYKMDDNKDQNDNSDEKNTDIFGQLLVPDNNMIIRNGKIIDDFSELKNGSTNSETVISEISNNIKNNNKSNTINPVEIMFQNGAQNDKRDNSYSNSNKSWKFINDSDSNSVAQNQKFNELKISNQNDSRNLNESEANIPDNSNSFNELDLNNKSNNSKDEVNISMPASFSASNDFINFTDLNTGKILPSTVDKYINLSNSNNNEEKFEIKNDINNSKETRTSINNINTNIDLKLDETFSDNDNYFDDFFDD